MATSEELAIEDAEDRRQFIGRQGGLAQTIARLHIGEVVRLLLDRYIDLDTRNAGMNMTVAIKREFREAIDYIVRLRSEGRSGYNAAKDEQIQTFERVYKSL